MKTKEKVCTSSKELIKSKFSRTWKMETKEKILTSSKISFLLGSKDLELMYLEF